MKLAEALILRTDSQKRLEQVKHRLLLNSKFQEGESPSEDPKDLEKELKHLLKQLKQLIQRVNRTNLLTPFDEQRSLGDALVERDLIGQERKIYSELLDRASVRHDRYSKTEIKFVTSINVKDTQKHVDELSLKFRLIDTRIQELNWLTDLVD
ncbi:MAG: DIP1984 family protein [Planococcaceae bacterium]|nr:DIP1984 family protein [Planococcaceae bacterium]